MKKLLISVIRYRDESYEAQLIDDDHNVIRSITDPHLFTAVKQLLGTDALMINPLDTVNYLTYRGCEICYLKYNPNHVEFGFDIMFEDTNHLFED